MIRTKKEQENKTHGGESASFFLFLFKNAEKDVLRNKFGIAKDFTWGRDVKERFLCFIKRGRERKKVLMMVHSVFKLELY